MYEGEFGLLDRQSQVSSAKYWKRILNLQKILQRGRRYAMKRMGPWTEPWATPEMTREGQDQKDFSWMN